MDVEEAIDGIYEAAVLSELWPAALGAADTLIQTQGAMIFAASEGKVNWVATEAFTPRVQDFIDGGYMDDNIRLRRGLELNYPGFSRDWDFISADEMNVLPMYTNFLRPRGFGSSVATAVPMHTGDMLVVHFEQSFERGPVPDKDVAFLDTLRPHFARAGLLASRLRMRQLEATVAGLAVVGLPAAVTGPAGTLLALNPQFEQLGQIPTFRAFSKLAVKHRAANDLLQEALQSAAKGHAGPRSIPVPATDGLAPTIFHVLPLRRQAHDLFSGGESLVVATPIGRPAAPPFEVLNALFDLTPAEARVASRLTAGLTLAQIAAETGVSVETVRGQLRGVLGKSGMHRQAELVGFLAAIGPGVGG